MKRSVGVTIAAVLTLVGSVLTLGFAMLMAIVMPQMSAATPQQPAAPKSVLCFTIAWTLGAALWGIATALGLFLRKNWSRISILVFSVLLLLTSVASAAVILMVPIPAPAGVPSSVMTAVKVFMGLFYGALAGIAVWWLILFTRKRVKEEFRATAPAAAGESANGEVFPGSPIALSHRPVSIAVIGWLLVVGAVMCAIGAVLRWPAMLLGTLYTGWIASAVFATWAVIELAIGVGLLRLREAGRIGAMCLFLFGLVNTVLMFALPNREARWTAMNESISSVFGTTVQPMPGWPPQSFFFAMGLIPAAVITLIALWFLVTRRQAFQRPNAVGTI